MYICIISKQRPEKGKRRIQVEHFSHWEISRSKLSKIILMDELDRMKLLILGKIE